MKILFIASEASPFAKSGGLGDVLGSLPKEIVKQGMETAVLLPLYKSVKDRYISDMKFLGDFAVNLSWRNPYCGIYMIEKDDVTYYFMDNEQYFGRENYYGYFDDGERFAYFSKAALEVLPKIGFRAEILHCSDWQTALVPVYLKTTYLGNPFYETIRTVFTIHNIAYQGQFDGSILTDILGIDEEYRGILDYRCGINYMKGAIVTCDKLTTVSPTYAEEIMYPYYGKGLESIISENGYKLSGILNGIDTTLFNPSNDKTIYANYSKIKQEKKTINKIELQKELGLLIEEEVPLIGMIGRLVDHKGIDLVLHVFDEMMEENLQIVILGSGDKYYEDFLREKAKAYKGRVAVITGFSSSLANKIYAGSDIFLMPSLSEPCGLAQMISSRYGSVPIVRETGGLKGSILPYNPETGKGNGITFVTVNAHDMLWAVKRALLLYEDKPNWSRLRNNAFNKNFSWKNSSKKYIKLYQELKSD